MLKRLIRNKPIRLALRAAQAAMYDAAITIYREIRFNRARVARFASTESSLVNVGCGELTKNGWINLDLDHPNDKRLYYNALNPLPFAAELIEHIHLEHFLEHLDYFNGCSFLNECFRVLEFGGSLRIIVPDLEKYIVAYLNNDKEFFNRLVHLGGSASPLTTRAQICNQMFRMGGAHKYTWDFETLTIVLKDAGFSSIERSGLNVVDPKYQIDGLDWWREMESLYLNAWK